MQLVAWSGESLNDLTTTESSFLLFFMKHLDMFSTLLLHIGHWSLHTHLRVLPERLVYETQTTHPSPTLLILYKVTWKIHLSELLKSV